MKYIFKILWPAIKLLFKVLICFIALVVFLLIFTFEIVWSLKIDIVSIQIYFLFVESLFTQKTRKIKNPKVRERFREIFWDDELEEELKKQKNEKQEEKLS